jgi:hypothetical protein
MGGCCARQQELIIDKKNCFQYSSDEVIKINPVIKPELNLERKKSTMKDEEIQLAKIILALKKIFKEKVDTITEVELLNIAIYNKESFISNDYLIFDMRKSSEQKEEYLKRIKHINYTFEQIKNIEKLKKLEILKTFIDNKIIILIIPEYYLNPKNNKEGFKKVDVYPIELCCLLYDINNNISFQILNCCLAKNEEQPNKFEDYLSVYHSYDIVPFILLSYFHLNTIDKEGYFFISFLEQKMFSFNSFMDYLNHPENFEINEKSFKNKFLLDMSITCIISIDNNNNNLENLFDITEYQTQKFIYKEIVINKNGLKIKKEEIMHICDWIKQEMYKGNSCYINIQNFDNNQNEQHPVSNDYNWIFLIIILLTIVTEVDYITVIYYLKEKMIYIDNIDEIIDDNINIDELLNVLKYLNN